LGRTLGRRREGGNGRRRTDGSDPVPRRSGAARQPLRCSNAPHARVLAVEGRVRSGAPNASRDPGSVWLSELPRSGAAADIHRCADKGATHEPLIRHAPVSARHVRTDHRPLRLAKLTGRHLGSIGGSRLSSPYGLAEPPDVTTKREARPASPNCKRVDRRASLSMVGGRINPPFICDRVSSTHV